MGWIYIRTALIPSLHVIQVGFHLCFSMFVHIYMTHFSLLVGVFFFNLLHFKLSPQLCLFAIYTNLLKSFCSFTSFLQSFFISFMDSGSPPTLSQTEALPPSNDWPVVSSYSSSFSLSSPEMDDASTKFSPITLSSA